MGKKELAERMIKAFESPVHAFIYQRELDDINEVAAVVREANIATLLTQHLVSRREGIYALMVNDAPCKAECSYGKCDPTDSKCVEKCIEECRKARIEEIVRRLKEYVKRLGG